MVLATAIRLPIPIASSSGRLSSILLSVTFCTIWIAAIVNILKTNALGVARISDIRVGSLLALGAFALLLLSKGNGAESVMRKTLAELRRDIVLGPLPLDEARHRTRITLQGLWLSDVVRDDVRALLKFISDVRALYDDAFRKIETLKASVPIASPSDAHLVDIEKIAVSNMLDVLTICEDRVNEISKQYFARLRTMQRRIDLALRLAKSASPDRANLIAEVKQAQGLADMDLDRFVREFHEIQSAWNLWYPSEARQHEPFGFSASNINRSQAPIQVSRGAPMRYSLSMSEKNAGKTQGLSR
jgi:hypothetical protein